MKTLLLILFLLPGLGQDDPIAVTGKVVEILKELDKALEGVKDQDSAVKSKGRVLTLVTDLTVLDKKKSALGNPILGADDALKLAKLESEGRRVAARVREHVERIAGNKTLYGGLDVAWVSVMRLFGQSAESNGRDPFKPSSKMLKQAFGENPYKGETLSRGAGVPQVMLRGYVADRDGKKLAIIELKGVGTFLVREQDKLTFDPGVLDGEMEVVRIDEKGIAVKSGDPAVIRIFR